MFQSFFRRTMKLKLEYTCLSRDVSQCNLRQVKGERPPCPACRFNKCVSLGMSLNGTILLHSMSTSIFSIVSKEGNGTSVKYSYLYYARV